ncbi:hypothetical protein CesoFtcFv8_008865 [Champsocephalus esox]|uniref:Uncharacterized protein n=1 Tax=Champsocephalus esox TaxID=159716 RepID=A0AAN8H226_9TELE|nr:hypothetical protein CesoFtcFv8_008865 [Champsocephalus esox]
MCVTLVFSTKGQRYLRVGLAVPLFGSLSCLRSMVAQEGNISPDQVILSELYSTGFQRSFSDDDDMTVIADSDVIYAFQAPPLHSRGGSTPHSGYHHSLPSSPYTSNAGPDGQRLPSSGTLSSEYLSQGGSTKVLLVICNTAGSGQQAVRFGPPFLMREDRSISWDQLQQSILSKLYYLMLNGSQAQNAGMLFKIRVVGGSSNYSYLSPQDSRPLYHTAVDRALKFCGPGGPPHVKVVIEWENKIKECLFGSIQEEVVKDAESVRNQKQQHLQQHSCTLDECFQLYTKEEQMWFCVSEMWFCVSCRCGSVCLRCGSVCVVDVVLRVGDVVLCVLEMWFCVLEMWFCVSEMWFCVSEMWFCVLEMWFCVLEMWFCVSEMWFCVS